MMFLKIWRVNDFKMADFNLFVQKYSSYLSTFKETSLDDHHKEKSKEYLCQDTTQEVINFDKIVENRYPDANKRPKTFDAIYFDKENNHLYMVEFKNQKKPDKKEVEEKLLEGKREFDLLMSDLNIAKSDYRFTFCLVYNKFIPKEERHKRGLYKSITFEFLNRYKESSFVDDIYTENVPFFTKQFKIKTLKELQC